MRELKFRQRLSHAGRSRRQSICRSPYISNIEYFLRSCSRRQGQARIAASAYAQAELCRPYARALTARRVLHRARRVPRRDLRNLRGIHRALRRLRPDRPRPSVRRRMRAVRRRDLHGRRKYPAHRRHRYRRLICRALQCRYPWIGAGFQRRLQNKTPTPKWRRLQVKQQVA